MSTSQRLSRQSPSPEITPQQPGHMAHGADGDCFGAVRGLLVVKTAAGTAHTVGCACVLRAQVCEIHLCRACARNPPDPDHLLVLTPEDGSKVAHRDLGCRWMGSLQPAIVPLTPGLCRVRSERSGEFYYFYCPSTGKVPCEPKLPVSCGEGLYIDPCNCLVYFHAALWLPVCDFSAVNQTMTYMVRWAPTGLWLPHRKPCTMGNSVPTISSSMQFAGCSSGESFLQWCMGVPWCVAKATTATFKLRPWRLNQTQPNRRKRAPAVACGCVAAENAAIMHATAWARFYNNKHCSSEWPLAPCVVYDILGFSPSRSSNLLKWCFRSSTIFLANNFWRPLSRKMLIFWRI